MAYSYPTPDTLGLRIPAHIDKARFCAGFRHALKGGHLSRAEYLRQSFREGFRNAKLFLRAYRRAQGILEFPMRSRMKFRALDS